MGGEKRGHLRRAIVIECEIDGTSRPAATRVTDLSARGCYVESCTPVSLGAYLMIRLTFGGAVITLTGRIAHMQPSIGFGMEFDSLSTEIIEAFLNPAVEQIADVHTA